MEKQLRAKNEKELNKLKQWFLTRFPEATADDLSKFVKSMTK